MCIDSFAKHGFTAEFAERPTEIFLTQRKQRKQRNPSSSLLPLLPLREDMQLP
jgi:hypothetical protein